MEVPPQLVYYVPMASEVPRLDPERSPDVDEGFAESFGLKVIKFWIGFLQGIKVGVFLVCAIEKLVVGRIFMK